MQRGIGVLLSAGLCAALIVGCGSSKVSVPTTATVVRTVTQTVAAPTATTATVVPSTSTVVPAPTTTAPVQTTTVPAATSTTAATAGSPPIPAETFQEALSGPPGAGKFPPGVTGTTCTSTYVGFSGQLTSDSANAAYAIAVSGSSPLTCPEAGDLAHDYLKAPGVDPGNSQAPPAQTTVDGYACGSYWYRPAGDKESPIPYATCEAPGAVMTIYGLEV